MIVSKSRVDRFTSYGETLRVTGTEGHLLHTDTYIKRKFKVELRVEEDEKKEDFGTFYDPPVSHHFPTRGGVLEIVVMVSDSMDRAEGLVLQCFFNRFFYK